MQHTSTTNLCKEESLNETDFPLGRWAHKTQGMNTINNLIQELFNEYQLAERSSGRLLEGRLLRSRCEIITFVIETLQRQGGHFKKQDAGGTWCIVPPEKARLKVSSLFSEYRKRQLHNSSEKQSQESAGKGCHPDGKHTDKISHIHSISNFVQGAGTTNLSPMLSDEDFPTGRIPHQYHNHPKIIQMRQFVESHADEYCHADQVTEEREYQGRRMRSKAELLTLAVEKVKPRQGTGNYKRRTKNEVTWEVDTTYNDKKLRSRVVNAFNKHLSAQAKNAISHEASEHFAGECENQRSTSERQKQIGVESIFMSSSNSCSLQSAEMSSFTITSQDVSFLELVETNSTTSDSVNPTALKTAQHSSCNTNQSINPMKSITAKSEYACSNAYMCGDSHLVPASEASCSFDRMICEAAESASQDPSLISTISGFISSMLSVTQFGLVSRRSSASGSTNPSVQSTPSNLELILVDEMCCDQSLLESSRLSIKTILVEIDKRKNDPYALTQILERLACMLIDVDGYLAMNWQTRDEIVTVVTQILQTCVDHEERILQIAMCVLGSLPDLRGEATAIKTIVAVIDVMRQHTGSPILQSEGCVTLSILIWYNKSNQTSIASEGGIDAVMTAMRLHSDHSLVQGNGCLALSNLAADHTSNQTIIGANGGIEAVVAAMHRFIENAELQGNGCTALGAVAHHHTFNQKVISALGGPAFVVAAMKHHPEDENVQRDGCYALAYLADNSFATNQISNQTTIASEGGIDTVIAAMLGHSRHLKVQNNGCLALCSLALNHAPNRAAIVIAGGIKSLIAAMKYHPDEAEIQEYGCQGLGYLMMTDASHQAEFVKVDGVSVVLAALDRHSKNTTLRRDALHLFYHLNITVPGNPKRAIEEVCCSKQIPPTRGSHDEPLNIAETAESKRVTPLPKFADIAHSRCIHPRSRSMHFSQPIPPKQERRRSISGGKYYIGNCSFGTMSAKSFDWARIQGAI